MNISAKRLEELADVNINIQDWQLSHILDKVSAHSLKHNASIDDKIGPKYG